MTQKALLSAVLTVAAAHGPRLRGNVMIKRSMVLTLALLASGCASQNQTQQTQTPTQAQMRFAMIKGIGDTAKFAADTCYAEVYSNPDSVAAKELLPLDDPSKASITQLASTARPTHDQITKMVAYKQNVDKCNEQFAAKMRDVDPAFYDIIHRSDQNLDGIIVELIQRRLNLGEAARAAKLVAQREQDEVLALGQKIVASVHQQHDAEIAQRQAAQAQRQAAQAQGEADLAAFGAAMQSSSYQFQQQQQLLQATTNFQPTQVMPITPPGGNQIRCINTGIYTNCRY
jgi:hypothetical protein